MWDVLNWVGVGFKLGFILGEILGYFFARYREDEVSPDGGGGRKRCGGRDSHPHLLVKLRLFQFFPRMPYL